jgi:hypothetical protein
MLVFCSEHQRITIKDLFRQINYTTLHTQYSPMSYQALEEVFAHPKLTISKLQRFRKEHLKSFCEVNSINVQWKGSKEPTKAAYTTALFDAVCHYPNFFLQSVR